MKIDSMTAQDLAEVADADLREDYSGRYMYGQECFALVTSDSPYGIATAFSKELQVHEESQSEEDDPEDTYGEVLTYLTSNPPRSDSMGMSTVYYWPGLQVTESGE